MSQTAERIKTVLAGAIRRKMAEYGLNVSSFARKSNTGRNSVRRLLDTKNTAITLRSIAQAADMLNLELTLKVRPLPLPALRKIGKELEVTRDTKNARSLKKQFLDGYYGKTLRA